MVEPVVSAASWKTSFVASAVAFKSVRIACARAVNGIVRRANFVVPFPLTTLIVLFGRLTASGGHRGNLVTLPLFRLSLHNTVTPAIRVFESSTVDDLHLAATVRNHSRPL